MDAYDYCPTCGRPVQGGRVCRYCAQTADPPQRERNAAAVAISEPRPEAKRSAEAGPADESAPARTWMLIALGVAALAVLVAVIAFLSLG